MKLSLYIYLCLFLILSPNAFAEGRLVHSLAEVEKGDFLLINDSNIEVGFNQNDELELSVNGNIGGFFGTTPDIYKLKAPFKLKETTCAEELANTDCSFNFSYMPYGFRLAWKKHSDSSKLNKTIYKVRSEASGGGSQPLIATDFDEGYLWIDQYSLDASEQFIMPSIKKIPAPHIICDQEGWLDKIFNQGDTHFVSEWSVEDMEVNTETNSNMNMTTDAALDVPVTLTNKNKLTLQGVGHTPFGEAQLLSDNFGWSVEKGGDYCEVSFTSDFNAIAKSLDSIDKLKNEIPAQVKKADILKYVSALGEGRQDLINIKKMGLKSFDTKTSLLFAFGLINVHDVEHKFIKKNNQEIMYIELKTMAVD